jgi:hypothetical protein
VLTRHASCLAILSLPRPLARSWRICSSMLELTGRPAYVQAWPCERARVRPTWMRSRMISGSSSANTEHMPSMARPVGVSLSNPLLQQEEADTRSPEVSTNCARCQHRAVEALHAPGSDDVELAGNGVGAQPVKRRPPTRPFGLWRPSGFVGDESA